MDLEIEFLDARRLTGPNLLLDKPGSVLDVRCDHGHNETLIKLWQAHVQKMLVCIGWEDEIITSRIMSTGVSLAFSAPIDSLYAATVINEWAWSCCESEISDMPMPNFESSLSKIERAITEEANPDLIKLEQAAEDHGIAFLWDDNEVTLGLGKTSKTWPPRELPDPKTIDWNSVQNIPIGIVTGTNGKTTTVRIVHHILRSVGINVGISSTDWIAVNDNIIDHGDWSGPGGARQVLRHHNVDTAILETARGGLLRRGLGVASADAALITNISEDHLGDFGSETMSELLDIKWITSHAVKSKGVLILNADDKRLVEKYHGYSGTIVWFSIVSANPVINNHVKGGGIAYIQDEIFLVRLDTHQSETLGAVREIPITMDGLAKHNVANVLAAAAMCEQLGVSIADIRNGLTTMSQVGNPGRTNVFKINGVNVLVDFAHNPAAMKAIFEVAKLLPANRRLLAFGQAGDRPDDLIRQLVQCAWSIKLDAVIVSELATYHRGRSYRDVYEIIKNELFNCGASDKQIQHFDEELDSLQFALEWAEPEDLIIMIALDERTLILEKLKELEANCQNSKIT